MASWGDRPFSQEGMLTASLWSRFAIHPPLATQNRRPKELKWFDQTFGITALLGFDAWTHLTCLLSLALPVVLIYVMVAFVT
jgi:hypothetical protein